MTRFQSGDKDIDGLFGTFADFFSLFFPFAPFPACFFLH